MATISDLEKTLFDAFPAQDATSGDRIGLLTGDAGAEVNSIALALDAKVSTIDAAASKGCNVLVTHHPVFWHAPSEFLSEGPSEGAAIYWAAKLGVSLIGMHTNLDCAPLARNMLLEPVGFGYIAPLSLPSELDRELQALPGSTNKNVTLSRESLWELGKMASKEPPEAIPALGQLALPNEGEALPLAELAQRYKQSFGAVAKVWGEPDTPVSILAACSGGGGSLVRRVISTGADCYVTGEVAYHEALELAAAGVALIELGHDRSELPYRFYLRDALLQAGYDASRLHVLEPTASWWH